MKVQCPFGDHNFRASPDHRGSRTPVDCPVCGTTFRLDGSPLTQRELWDRVMDAVRDFFNARRSFRAGRGAAGDTK